MTLLRTFVALPLLLLALLPASAEASDRPAPSNALVIIVEAPRALLDPARLRRVLGRRLERPCVSLLDDEAPNAAAVLSIVLDTRGQGRIELHPRGGVASYIAVVRPRHSARSGAWLASLVNELLEAGMSTPGRRYALCREVLDPWPPTSVQAARAARLELPSEVLDPFADSPDQTSSTASLDRSGMVRSEVLDPWAGYHPNAHATERADRLARPSPSVRRPHH